MNFHAYAQTDQGKHRDTNEDAYMFLPSAHTYAVADGLGGLPRGEVASATAVNSISEDVNNGAIVSLTSLKEAVKRANIAVFEEGEAINEDIGIGTTLTLLRIHKELAQIAHVGDTRLYLLRNRQIRKITKDHTMAQDVRDGLAEDEETYIPDYFEHTLTRCLGQKRTILVDIYEKKLEPKDRIILCSDGVDKVIDDDELTLFAQQAESPENLVQTLITEANLRGGPDNITAIAIFVE